MQSETSRLREIGAVAGYAVIIVVATPIVARMLGTAWNDRGLAYDLIRSLTETAGVNFDLGVIVPIGFVLALIILFSLDEYKQIQTFLLALGCVGFVLTLVQMGMWTEAIDWRLYWWGLILGGVGGIIGLRGAKFPTRGRREFPAAAVWLYRAVAVVVVMGLLEYHLTYENEIAVQLREFYVTIPASLILLMAVAEFVKYSNKKDVVIIGRDNATEANFLGGLFQEARNRFDGIPLDPDGDGKSAVFLNKVATAVSRDSMPEQSETTVSFRFTSGGFFSRQVVVTANRYDPPTKRDIDLLRDQIATETNLLFAAGRFARRRVAVLIPRFIRKLVYSDSDRMADRLRSADSILLLAPLSDFIDEEQLKSKEFDSWRSVIAETAPEYMEIYQDLCEIYTRNDRKAVIVTTEASLGMQVYEDKETRYPSFRDTAFRSFLQNTILTANAPETSNSICDVIAVDRNLDEERDASGFDYLLHELS